MRFNQIIPRRVLQLASAFLLLVSVSVSASGTNCDVVLDESGRAIISSEVCKDDVLLNSLSVFTSTLTEESERSAEVYQKIIGDDPLQMPASSKAISDIIFELMLVISSVAAILVLFFLLWRVGSIIYGGMFNDEKIGLKDVLSPQTIGLVAGCILIVPMGDYVGLGVISFFAATLGSIALSVYISTLSFGLVQPMSGNSIDGTEVEGFELPAEQYAVSLVKSLSVAQDSSIYASFLSVEPENALIVSGESSTSEGLFGGVWRFFAREDRDPTFAEVYNGLFSDHSFQMNMRAPQGGKAASTSVEIFSGKPTEAGETQTPLFVQDYTLNDIFEQTNAFSVTGKAPELSNDAFKTIASSSRLPKIANSALVHGTDIDTIKRASKAVAEEVLLLVTDVTSKHPEAHPTAIVNAMQGFLMGTYSVRATQMGLKSANYKLKPFEIPDAKEDEPIFALLGLADQAIETARAVQCIRFLPDAAYEIESFYRLSERGGDTSIDYKTTSQVGDVYPICVHPNKDASPSLLLSHESQDRAYAIYKHFESGVDESTLSQGLADLKRELERGDGQSESEMDQLVEQANEQLATIKNYYAIIGAASRYGVAEYVGAQDSEANYKADEGLRFKGMMGLPMGFLSSASRQNAFNDAVALAEPSINLSHGSEESTNWLTRREIKKNVDRQAAAVNTSGGMIDMFTDGESFSAGATQSAGTGANAWVDWILDNAVFMLVPDSDVLTRRFGWEGADGNLAAGLAGCSTDKTCIHFEGHPIHAFIEFSLSLFTGGVGMLMIDALVQSINTLVQDLTGKGEDTDGGIFDMLLDKAKEAAATALPVVKVVGALVAAAAFVSSILAKFAMGGIVAGAVGSILMPTQVLYGWLKQVLEAIMLIVTTMLMLPILMVLMFPQVGGKPVVAAMTVLRTCLGALIAIPLLSVSFVVFIGLSYVAVYLANTIGGVLIVSVVSAGSSGITVILFAILSVIIWIGLVYFAIMASLKASSSLTDLVQKTLGVDGQLGKITDDMSSVFAVGTVIQNMKEAHGVSKQTGKDLARKASENKAGKDDTKRAPSDDKNAPAMQQGRKKDDDVKSESDNRGESVSDKQGQEAQLHDAQGTEVKATVEPEAKTEVTEADEKQAEGATEKVEEKV